MKSVLNILILSCFVVGCTEKENAFSTYSELKISGQLDEKVLEAIPEGATKIVLWENSDLNTVRVQYSFHGNQPFIALRMVPAAPSLLDDALAIFPLLEGKGIKDVRYRCSNQVVKPDVESDTRFNFYEVEFTGKSDTEMFYWNTRNKVEYQKFCASVGNP